jgi:diguanylate cyclase (GGDEF)-like protein
MNLWFPDPGTFPVRWHRPAALARLARYAGWLTVAVSVLGLALLSYGSLNALPIGAVILAAGCVLAALIRAAPTIRERPNLARIRPDGQTDDLTGLPNGRHFHACLKKAASSLAPGRSVAVLLIDIDRFKQVNNRLGYRVGDSVLRVAGGRLADVLRPGDLLARLGGDQFGVLIGNGADELTAVGAAKRLRDVLQAPFLIDDFTLHLDAAIGVAVQADHPDDADALLQQANIAMDRAKSSGTGVQTYSPQPDGRIDDRLTMTEALRTALYDEDQFVLHYQPKLTLATGCVSGVEALVRWRQPDRGLIFPDQFLPLAEAAGLMPALTTVVLDQALRQCAAWRSVGLDLSVAVNLSTSDLLDPELPVLIDALLTNLSVPPSALHLEITESVVMRDPERSLATLERLDALGVRLAVDDYGTGYSSLAYLSTLPVHDLKLDKSFVIAMGGDGQDAERARSIVASTVTLSNALGLDLIAEGVETAEILTQLRELGCTAAQGYHISRPLTATALTAWLKTAGQAHAEAN